MPDVDSNLRVVLIGGTSHVGKSTLAESLAARLGWTRISTDSLARHPGRPWKPKGEEVPDHVAEHYLSLSVDELLEDVLRHYRAVVWPKVEAIVASRLNDSCETGLVLEGSALWPLPPIGVTPLLLPNGTYARSATIAMPVSDPREIAISVRW